ncbi:MAG TPA: glycosyltransferase family 4 protein [Solirubrobacterales bacterium]|jgi:glycosyltransferase involved in cell wall biosynthesis|nr:glycosyltransferase family 4 protein [Solirubrobacterales bacterium]
MRTVIASSFTPTLDSGRARRTYGIVRALAARGRVDLVYGAFGANRPDPAYESIPALSLHRVERPGAIARMPAYLRARLRGVPDDFARGIWPDVAAQTARLAGEGVGSRVVAEGPVAAAALLPYANRHPATYSAHNLEYAFRHRLDEAGMSEAALKRFEALLLRTFAESWMVSKADVAGAAALVPGARLRLVPNVVDVAAIEPLPPRAGERTVLFLADLGYEPNREALRFLLERAMPALWRTAADVRLLVAGKGSDEIGQVDSRVELRGFVPELRALYAEAGCVAVPLLEGGGSPLKFVEALAYAAPVVATPRAAAGLEVEAGVHYIEAEPEGESFAAGILAALEPACGNGVAAAGRGLAEREYSLAALERCLA